MSEADSGDTWYWVWETAWGPMGAFAINTSLRRIILPHHRSDELEDLLLREHPLAGRSDRPFKKVVRLTRAYFDARCVDFSDVICALPSEDSFLGRVYRACREIPYGMTVSYSELGRRISRPRSARAVGGAMSRNPIPLVVPCHRVICRNGDIGGFSAPGGLDLKRRMLDMEKGALRPGNSPER